jgi:hypothetical protein
VPLDEATGGASGASRATAVADPSPGFAEPAVGASAGAVRGGSDGWTLFPELEG